MNIKPLGNNVLLKPVPRVTGNPLITIPDSVKKEQERLWIVAAVGSGEDVRVKVGDHVITEILYEAQNVPFLKECKIVDCCHIQAVYEPVVEVANG